ncbi:unnamed protein product [Acanthosepion pharaonis]|uniref:ATP-dependent DNA helicase n=1 Tax=Acanthosepion pharaonis TaxID=158019 RepID=A0A812EZU6_ACAPH|nr:unnamed protein product [Sepia pharaonis]
MLLAIQPAQLNLPFDGPRRPRLRKPHVTQRKLRQRSFDSPRNPWLRKPSAARTSESSAQKRTRRQRDAFSTSAASGIAATLIAGGRTVHSTFKLPLELIKAAVCSIAKQSGLAEVLRRCKLMVWDECTLSPTTALEAVNCSLKDIRNSDDLMGGITVLISGDFRQNLPVVPKGRRADAIRACLKSSQLLPTLRPLHLTTNMRAHLTSDVGSAEFSNSLLALGEVIIPADTNGFVNVQGLSTVVPTPATLRESVFPDLQTKYNNIQWLAGRAILAPKNTTVTTLKRQLLETVPGVLHIYKSIDRTLDPAEMANFPVEFLNSLHPAGLPPHILELKVRIPVM